MPVGVAFISGPAGGHQGPFLTAVPYGAPLQRSSLVLEQAAQVRPAHFSPTW